MSNEVSRQLADNANEDTPKWINTDEDKQAENQESSVLMLEDVSLEFQFPGGKKVQADLIQLKMLMEEYIGDRPTFKEHGADIVNLLEQEYSVKASITIAWQFSRAIETAWDEFKKKVVEPQTLLLSTI